jgi:hypothetical protein
MKPIRLTLTALIGLSASALLFACSSSSAGPGRTNNNNDSDSGSVRAPGDWACYPPLGNYKVTYTLKAGQPSDCPALPESETEVREWKGGLGTPGGCEVTADEATCTTNQKCEYEDKTVTTSTTFDDGKVPPVHGTRHIVTKTPPFVATDGGTYTGDSGTYGEKPRPPRPDEIKLTDCTYDFTYTKK